MRLETRIKVGDLFDELDKEEEGKKDRKFKVKSIGKFRFEKLIKLFDKFYRKRNETYSMSEFNEGRPEYHAKDIEKFSCILASFQGSPEFEMVGYFLSRCINCCIEDKVVLHTHFLSKKIDNIGYLNIRKKIIVKGDVGKGIGNGMWDGEIIVEGNSGNYPGYCLNGGKLHLHGNVGECAGHRMEGGEIIIYGNAGDSAGYGMKGGTLIIHGHAGAEVGKEMRRNAEIHLYGRYKSIGPLNSCLHKDFPQGKIYHQSELIIKDGRRVR